VEIDLGTHWEFFDDTACDFGRGDFEIRRRCFNLAHVEARMRRRWLLFHRRNVTGSDDYLEMPL
jgi:hypothetical protein